MGHMVDRTRRELSEADIALIAGTYHAWRQGEGYADVPGFGKAASIAEICLNGHMLTPERYVGGRGSCEGGGVRGKDCTFGFTARRAATGSAQTRRGYPEAPTEAGIWHVSGTSFNLVKSPRFCQASTFQLHSTILLACILFSGLIQ